MTYLPSEYINSNYSYYLDNNYFVVKTNKDCYTNYNTTYCTCNRIYPNSDYLVSSDYSCSLSNYNLIPYSQFTDDVYYRTDFDSILIIFLIMCIFCFYIPIKIFTRLFRRFQ